MPIASPVVIRLSIFLLACLLCAGAAAQESFSSLEERMTAEEFREAGLDKLSEAELAALNRWIRMRSLAEGEVPDEYRQAGSGDGQRSGEDRRGFQDSGRDAPIEARIQGSFSGWTGNTRFELDNGMVWRQAEAGQFAMPATENPQVTISPGMFGAWYLSVEGYSRRVRVERVR